VVTLDDIKKARKTISDALMATPMFSASRLGEAGGGVELFLKAESLQKTGSFKPRGALNLIRNTPKDELGRGVITISAGNHAQGVAWAAGAAGVEATIVMQATASPTKIAATRGYGADVVLVDGTISEAFAELHRLKDERGLTLIHPFDDPLLIAGHGTVGLEIVEQVPDVDVIVCPIGGGGLISGVATAAKTTKPDVRIYGIEPVGAPAMRKSWNAGSAQQLDSVDTIADGLAPPMVGELNYQLTREHVDDVILVDDTEIAIGIREIMTNAKLYSEPAGAAATAALLAGKVPVDRGETVVALLSGGNLDIPRMLDIIGKLD
jgi:threonine dehydratase